MFISRMPRALLVSLCLCAPVAHAATVTAAFTSAATVPVSEYGYYASPNDLKISLGFAPPRGTALTVVRNTGNSFISGRFSNLAQGQVVKLAYGGVTYRFVANYHGGTGNDLVLQWAFQSACSWGDNAAGQLGNNSTTESKVPLAVTSTGILSGKTVMAVAAGASHSLALCSNGTLAAWGTNSFGQLGNNSTTRSSLPVAVLNTGVLSGRTVIAIAAGYSHNLALCSDGMVAAWGDNSRGQLGSFAGTYSTSPAPVNFNGVLAGKTVVAVAAGFSHSLALCSDGTLAAWGANDAGQLGNGSTTPSTYPVLVTRTGVLAGQTVVSLTAGYYHSIALCSDGRVATWGSNGAGQLGNGKLGEGSNVPIWTTRTGGLSGKISKAIAGGANHSLALNSDGTIATWGNNSYAQLGNGLTTFNGQPATVTRTGVLSGKTVTAATAGGSHNLALCSDGSLVAWGYNNHGQLGNNTTTTPYVPVAVTSTGALVGRTPVAIAAGAAHSLIVTATSVSSPVSESSLTGLALGGGALISPSFTSGHLAYQATVPSSTSAVTLTPVLAGATASVKVNGTAVASGSATAPIPLAYGTNVLSVVVKAADGVTISTYTVTVTRTPLLAISTLSGLELTGGTLSPAFTASTTIYTSAVPNQISSVTLTPTVTHATATVKVNGVTVASGATSPAIPLAVGNNTLSVRVTAQNGTTITTYTISITRAASPGSLLSGLTLDGGILTPAFRPRILSYSASVPSTTASITLTPTTADASSGITVNGVAVISGSSLPISLSPGINTILVQVTAADASTTTYTLKVVRPTPVDFVYASAAAVPADFPAYDATGLTANLALGFAPTVGTTLTIVKNSGTNFITGRFVNLAQDQPVILAYQGINYRFVADYHGGSGNDLVLHWATRGLCSWGYNAHGELGNGGTTDSSVPVNLAETPALQGKTVVAAAAGGSHSLILCSDGSMAAWGQNSFRQLGNGANTSSSVATAVTVSPALAGKTVIAVAASYFNLALCSDGTLVSWGSNSSGQLGNGDTTNNGLPRAVIRSGVLAGKTVVAMAAGGSHSLALCSDGTLAAWGGNNFGQLGDATTSDTNTPVEVNTAGILADKTVVAIAAGSAHSLALCADGTLVAWGSNSSGILGNGGGNSSNIPVAVDRFGVLAGKSIISIQAGSSHSLALCSDGTLAAWGDNFFGQLGTGNDSDSAVPVGMNSSGFLAGKTVLSATTRGYHSLTQCANGTLAAWGPNGSGELGNGGTAPSNFPVAVNLTGGLAAKTVQSLSAGSSHNIALTASLSPVSALSDIGMNLGSLNRAFSPAVLDYTGSVPATASSVTITPVAVDPTATFKINGIAVATSSTVPLGSGATVVTVQVTAQDGVTTRTYTLTVEKSDYASWLATNPPLADFSAAGDPDHDRIPNLLEYVLNGNPNEPSSAILPVVATDADHFIFTFKRRENSTLETTQVFQFSPTPGDWADVAITAPTDARVTLGAVDPDGSQTVTVRIPKNSNPRLFGRLKVTRP